MSRAREPRRTRGLTLIELMVVVGLVALLATLALPSFGSAAQRARLKSTAEHLAADLADARHAAAQRGLTVHLAAKTGAQWCWAVATTPGCGCDAAAQCQLNRVSGLDNPGVTLAAAQPLAYDARGVPTAPGALLLQSAGGEQLRVEVAALGRAFVCAPGPAVAGYPAC